jgi:CrcB protein
MTNTVSAPLLVGLGGLAGSVARYSLSFLAQRFSLEWPLGTLAANLLGCLAIGIITEASDRGEAITPATRLLLATGFCGGFTTLSTLIYEAAQMTRDREYLHAAAYVGGTLLFAALAFAGGILLVRGLTRVTGALWN